MPTKLLLVDGNNLVLRMAGVPAFAKLTYKGQPTGAIHASIDNLLTTIDKLQPDEVVISFDGIGAKEKKQRDVGYAGYKAGRGPMIDAVASQLHATRDILRAMGLLCFHQPQIDTDDVLGTLSRMHQIVGGPRRSTIIYSNDKDFFQLCDDYTCVMRPGFDFWYADRVCETFGVQKTQYFADYLAIVGDGVDGIPGLPNIGPKTAKDWLQTYPDVTSLIEDYDGPKRHVIDDNADMLLKYLKLTRINTRLFNKTTLELQARRFRPGSKTERLSPLLRQYGLTRLQARLGLSNTVNGYKTGMFAAA